MPNERILQGPTPGAARPWPFALPTLRQTWFQIHWLVGITAGSVIMLIGLSGALLSFREELLDVINPGVRTVAVRAARALAPQQLVDAVAREHGDRRVASLTLSSEPGVTARVQFAPAGQRKGETVYLDPYTGATRPALSGADFFEWVESLHRWLLLPREPGRVVTGVLAFCLLGMALSGLYLRWPRRPLAWRSWLTFDTRLRGRPFLWGLHSVLGTWALVLYVASTSTGIYWSYDFVRGAVDGWMGVSRPQRESARSSRGDKADGGERQAGRHADLTAAWAAFEARAGAWQLATLRLPELPAQALQINWLASDAPHERARSRMTVAADGSVAQDLRYAALPRGERALTVIYPLHMGTYFGLPGRLTMMLAALSLPVFGVTGWMLYLGRRRQKRAMRDARGGLVAAAHVAHSAATLVVHASQSGQAERLALQSAVALQGAGLAVVVQAADAVQPEQLRRYGRLLVIASSFGEGDPPDGARRFARRLGDPAMPRMAGLRYGLLALGDRHYPNFCGFGHALDARLRALGAEPLFPLIEVDGGDPAAVMRWSRELGALSGAGDQAFVVTASAAQPFDAWTLSARTLLNPGSVGAPLYEVALTAAVAVAWRPGALVEVLPRQPADAVSACLERLGLDGTATVVDAGVRCALAEALSTRELSPATTHFDSPQAYIDALARLAPRRYSVASLPDDGALQLLVRQERHERGLGLASGWLTAHATVGGRVALRLLENPAFEAPDDDVPCLYIGNGSGLAGLRAHLRARVRAGRHENWLVFGERQRAHDRLCADEIRAWQDAGRIARVDLAFSRDGDGPRYVQDCLRAQADDVLAWVAQGAVVFVCGSADGMAAGVDDALGDILGAEALDALIAAGRYRRDVY